MKVEMAKVPISLNRHNHGPCVGSVALGSLWFALAPFLLLWDPTRTVMLGGATCSDVRVRLGLPGHYECSRKTQGCALWEVRSTGFDDFY